MVTTELAADGATAFFFSLGVPRLNGTVQAIINLSLSAKTMTQCRPADRSHDLDSWLGRACMRS